MGIQGVTRGYRGLQGCVRPKKGIPGVKTASYGKNPSRRNQSTGAIKFELA